MKDLNLNEKYKNLLISQKLANQEDSDKIKWDIVLTYIEQSKVKLEDEDSISYYRLRLFDIIDKYNASKMKLNFNTYFNLKAGTIRNEIKEGLYIGKDGIKDIISLQSAKEYVEPKDFVDEIVEKDFYDKDLYKNIAGLSAIYSFIVCHQFGFFSSDRVKNLESLSYLLGVSVHDAENMLKVSLRNLKKENGIKDERSFKFLELLKVRDRTTNIPFTKHTLALLGIDKYYGNKNAKRAKNFTNEELLKKGIVDRTRILIDNKGKDILTIDQLINCVKNKEEILTRERTKEDCKLLEEVYKINSGKISKKIESDTNSKFNLSIIKKGDINSMLQIKDMNKKQMQNIKKFNEEYPSSDFQDLTIYSFRNSREGKPLYTLNLYDSPMNALSAKLDGTLVLSKKGNVVVDGDYFKWHNKTFVENGGSSPEKSIVLSRPQGYIDDNKLINARFYRQNWANKSEQDVRYSLENNTSYEGFCLFFVLSDESVLTKYESSIMAGVNNRARDEISLAKSIDELNETNQKYMQLKSISEVLVEGAKLQIEQSNEEQESVEFQNLQTEYFKNFENVSSRDTDEEAEPPVC